MKAPKDTRLSSGEQTRQKLVEAGLVLFGERGFDGVSTRALAQAAGVNQAAILYHFQSKEGLYLAVVSEIVSLIRPGLEPLVFEIQAHLAKGSSKKQAIADIQNLVIGLLREVLRRSASDDACSIAPFMLREQLKPSNAFDVLYRGLLEPLHMLLCQLVAIVRGCKENDINVIIEVQALSGQAIIFGAHHTTLLRRLGRVALDDKSTEQIVAVIRASLARQFA